MTRVHSPQAAHPHRAKDRAVVADIAAGLSREQRSQLLYVECRAVDNGGLLNLEQMNADDRHAMNAFERMGLLSWDYLSGPVNRCAAWAVLTEWGWAVAHACREMRGRRGLHEVVASALAEREMAAAVVAEATTPAEADAVGMEAEGRNAPLQSPETPEGREERS